MNRRLQPLLAFVLLAVAPRAAATAGFAEHEEVYHYDQNVLLWWGHSDLCYGENVTTKDCLRFIRDDEVGVARGGLYDRVSVPPSPSTGLAIVRGFGTNTWHVVETATGKSLVDAPDERAVREFWQARGLPAPRIVSVDDVDDHFRETWDSRKQRYLWMGLIWGSALLLPISLLIVPALLALMALKFVKRLR